LFTNPNKKTPASLNIGIKNSNHEIIVILGAHSCLHKDFLLFNNKFLVEKNVSVTGGTQINKGLNYIQQAIGLSMQVPFAMASAAYRWSKKEKFVDTVVYAAYKRHLFDEVGFFDEHNTISEDAEFNWRIRRAGYKIFYSPQIITYYYPRSAVLQFIKQMFRYGILRVNVLKKHLDSVKIAHLIPPTFVFTLSILLILTLNHNIHQNFLFYFLTVYFIINIMISAFTLSLRKIKYLPLVPVLTFIMHFFWGLGFIVGLFKIK
jgi:cellulose synthase/poly-beta-1,6-N-acetylglucosamine synthase-like glycosyltransferase